MRDRPQGIEVYLREGDEHCDVEADLRKPGRPHQDRSQQRMRLFQIAVSKPSVNHS
jgi:hypothetical protein